MYVLMLRTTVVSHRNLFVFIGLTRIYFTGFNEECYLPEWKHQLTFLILRLKQQPLDSHFFLDIPG